MSSDGLLVVLSGPSGVGKSTVARKLLARSEYQRSISVTTRAPRAGEVDGRDYSFASRDSFESWRAAGRFLEWAEVHGNLYGTLREPVARAVAAGRVILLVIDVQGGESVRGVDLPQLLVFLQPPSFEVLEQRLRKRGTEGDAAFQRRLRRAREEMEQGQCYDSVVINDALDETVGTLQRLIEDARHGRHPARNHG